MAKQQKRKTNSSAVSTNSTLPVASRSKVATFDPDYTYVVKDLRTIGTLAIIFIAVLVILSFII